MKEPFNEKNNGFCGNCHNTIGDATYCSQCGQKNTDGRITVRDFFSVVFVTVFNLESKFFQTLRDIFRPGKLTVEWFKGKHKPYFHPIRLFIVTALLLIAALSLFVTDDNSMGFNGIENAQRETYRKEFLKEIDNYSALYLEDNETKAVLDSLTAAMKSSRISSGRRTLSNFAKSKNLEDLKDKTPDEIIGYFKKEIGVELTDSLINVVKSKKLITKDSVKLANLFGDSKKLRIANEDFLNLNPTELADKYNIVGLYNRLHFKKRVKLQKDGKDLLPFVLGNSLWIALLMMPFLALILRFLYFRHNYYYVEHLIFSFHTHSFAFILFACICIFMKLVYLHPLIVFAGFFVLFIYLFLSLRNVYEQGKIKTLFKLIVINATYLGLFLGFAILGLIVSLVIF